MTAGRTPSGKGFSMILPTRSIVVAAAFAAAPANAADQAATQISGSLPQTCAVTAPANQSFDPASTAVQAIGSPSYQCNFIGGASLRFWTLNGGLAISPAGPNNGNVAQSRAYNFNFDGTNLGQLGNADGSAVPVVRAISLPNTVQVGIASMQLGSAATIAGTYTDTIFVSIAP